MTSALVGAPQKATRIMLLVQLRGFCVSTGGHVVSHIFYQNALVSEERQPSNVFVPEELIPFVDYSDDGDPRLPLQYYVT